MKSKFFIYKSCMLNMDLIAVINLNPNDNNVEIFLKDGFKIDTTTEDLNDFGEKLGKFIEENDNET